MNIRIFLCLIVLGVSGCATAPAVRVPDAQNVESVSAIWLTCGNPFELTQDCSNWSGPNKSIEVQGLPMKVAGNESGTITLMFAGSGTDRTRSANTGYEILKQVLLKRNSRIVRVTPVESNGIMFGYAIETSEPAYSIWDEFAVVEQ